MKSSLPGILWREFTWRHWRRSPKSTALLVVILALGVGVFFSIRLANRAAVAGFGLFTENLTGECDFVVSSPSGMMREAWLPEMREVLDGLPLALYPVLETTATDVVSAEGTDGFSAEQFQVMGLDIYALPNLIYLTEGRYRPPQELAMGGEADDREGEGGDGNARDGIASRAPVFIARALADQRGLSPGDTIELIFGDAPAEFEIGGVLPETDLRASTPSNLILMDLPEVQRLAGEQGRVQRVEARLPPGPLAEKWRREGKTILEAASAGRWRVDAAEVHRGTGAEMTRAFRMNLTILSGLALLVGVYLILQALEAAVVKRRLEIGVLRSLGVRPRAIRMAWLAEALTLGLAGSFLGLLLGWCGAQFAVRAVARTVNSLYFSTTTEAAAWDGREAGLALFAGLTASIVAGWLPARDAARTPPAQVLQRGARGGGIRLLNRPLVGLALLVAGFAGSQMPPLETGAKVFIPVGGYVAALCWVVGGSILAGGLFRPIAGMLRRCGGESAGVRYAASHLRRPTGRHRLASAGVVIAVAMAAAMGILVQSFESTVTAWIDRILRADLYIACQGAGNISSRNRLSEETWRALAADDAVAEAEVGQIHPITMGDAPVFLAGVDFGDDSGWEKMIWIVEPEMPWEAFESEVPEGGPQPVLINETFRYRFSLDPGARLQVPTPLGAREVVVAGVFADYGSERGTVMASRRAVAKWFGDERASTLAVYLKEGEDAEKVRRRLQASHAGLMIRTNSLLREEAIRIFHQTFLVTHALKWIGVAVALAGQALALVSILMDRRRELATLKEIGMTRRDISRSVALEGVGMTAAGAAGGILLSLGLGYLLIEVINRQSFGWTLTLTVPIVELGWIAAVVIATSWIVARVAGGWGALLPSDKEE